MPFPCIPSQAKDYRCLNFSAGPSSLPVEILYEAQEQMLNWNHSGMSVMEMSHRGKEFMSIYNRAMADLKEIIQIPDEYKLLFTVGGATQQFAAVPMNLCSKLNEKVEYIVTGQWSKKAVEEANKYAKVNVVLDIENNGLYTKIPPLMGTTWAKLDKNAKYLHYTSNETISGVQYPLVPHGLDGVPLVCDMSSDFCTKPIEVSKHGVIYAGAQKNIGPAGVTVTIVREDLIGKQMDITPATMMWKWAAEYDSMFNTPPCWSIYVMGLYAKFIKEKGGLTAVHEKNLTKSAILYDYIDGSDGFYRCQVELKPCRSLCNATFNIYGNGGEAPNVELEKKFVNFAREKGLIQLEGHRSVGGLRASMYNAMPKHGVETLVECMKMFKDENQ